LLNRTGFTLIELMIVVIIVGLLAAIAVPKFGTARERAYIASMKSDLRNFVNAEEAYFADSVKYTTAVSCVTPVPAGSVSFCTSTGNTLGTVTTGAGTQAGWTVSITSANTATSCAIYTGSVAPAAPATAASPEGAAVCQ
jgi:prepilin-type N-terminal cleavage/methylation domain-containing protein